MSGFPDAERFMATWSGKYLARGWNTWNALSKQEKTAYILGILEGQYATFSLLSEYGRIESRDINLCMLAAERPERYFSSMNTFYQKTENRDAPIIQGVFESAFLLRGFSPEDVRILIGGK